MTRSLNPDAAVRFLAHGADLIEHGRALNATVLVHCNMGVSRSSAQSYAIYLIAIRV